MSMTIESQTLIAGRVDHDFEMAPPMELWTEELRPVQPARPLPQIAPGPWRSLGRYLDYTNWADRDRFVELDRAIEANAQLDEAEDAAEETPEWSTALDPESPFAIWGLRPIGGGHLRPAHRRGLTQ